jgi:hypothetical protein
VIVVTVCAGILGMLMVTYLLARGGRRSRRDAIPPRHLPSELQRQELDRLAFQHRVRTRVILDSALHNIQKAAGEHRNGR